MPPVATQAATCSRRSERDNIELFHMEKPFAAFIAVCTAPKRRRMVHAGAIIGGTNQTAQVEMDAGQVCVMMAAESPADLGTLMAKALEARVPVPA